MARLTGFDDAALKEQFSVTYVRAVAYAAGAVVDELKVDRDSIDVVIRARGQVGSKRSPSVEAQLKCHTGWLNARGELVYDLPIKNHRDLVPSNHLVPRILVVVAVPEDSAGVSSNLCSALASVGNGPESVALEVGLRWAALRDLPMPNSGPFFFGRDYLEVLGSAAARLREQETEELHDQEITGFVTSLERGYSENAGTVVVYGFLESGDRPGGVRCSIELTGEQYALAARAHVEHALVSVRGLVRRVGHKWWLEEPSGFWADARGESRSQDRDDA